MIDLTNTTLDGRLQLIDYAKATPDTLRALIEAALHDAITALDAIETDALPTDATAAIALIEKFDESNVAIERYFGALSHLNSVASTDEIRQAHHEMLPKLSDFGTRVGQSTALYQLYQLVSDQFDSLPSDYQTDAWRAAIDKQLQSFIRSGVALDDAKKQNLATSKANLAYFLPNLPTM